jgi:thymidylate synthase (FAD)
MPKTTELQAQLVGWTRFDPPPAVPWNTDVDDGQALVEFAGRACYQSWNKPNPATATNAGYVAHLLEVGHLSVLEHGSATFYLTGVSRSFTHELVRHRHFSYSQLSQRYVADDGQVIEPEVIAADPYLHAVFTDAVTNASCSYRELVHGLERIITSTGSGVHQRFELPNAGQGAVCAHCLTVWPCPDAAAARTAARKKARQAARSVLPNATETRIVVTGNYRAWRHFITLRAGEAADVEIRAAAIVLLRLLQNHAPNVFADFRISVAGDGSEVAHSRLPADNRD